jgi:peptidoglycan/LPS O-acetylase OafA/YrhL
MPSMRTLAPARTLGSAIDSHDNGFNLVRLVCALLVVLFHAWPMNMARPGTADPLSPLLAPHVDLGGLAVGVFFLISGIFITQSWVRDPHLLRFAVRRVARIVPGLFVCLLLTTVVAVVFFSAAGWHGLFERATWRYVFGNTWLHGLRYIISPKELSLPGVLDGQPLNGPLWTLYWEGRMYVMVALLGLAAALPLRTWFRAAALFLLLAANLWPDVAAGYVWEVRMWSLFLCGMLAFTLAPELRIGPLQVACVLVFVALNATRWIDLTHSPLTWFGIALAACTLGLAAGSSARWSPAHVQRHDYSYALYIYHWPVLLMLRAALPPLGPLGTTLATVLVTALLAVFSWHCVEAPAQRWSRRWLKRRGVASKHAVATEQA